MFFPLYPDNILTGPYHVSLALPGPISSISKSIGLTSSTALLFPNVEYLEKFIDGDIGIGDSIIKSMLTDNYNSKITSSNEGVFKSFSKSNKIELDDISKYKKDDKFVMPKSEIKIPSEFDTVGLKSIEKTTLKSIFETQKPYIEIAKLIIENLANIEDIIARVMPLVSISPLSCKSEKPIINSGSDKRPKAMGFNSGDEIKKSLSKINSISNKGGKTKVDKNGKAIKPEEKQESINQNSNYSETIGQWEIISTVYSTGEFDPNIEYNYQYIDLPKEETKNDEDYNLNLDNSDIYKKYKPKNIVLGIFDSDGKPLNPRDKIKSYSNNGQITNTNFSKADWLVNSPKWKFRSNSYTWPVFGDPFYIWEKGLQTKENKTNPNPDDGWVIKKYKQNEKNRITGNDAIPGDPIITKFEQLEQNTIKSYFTDLIKIDLENSDLEKTEKDEVYNQVITQLDINGYLENLFLYGQSKSSFYKKLNVPGLSNDKNPFPVLLKKTFKPFKIKSEDAAKDPILRKYNTSIGEEPGIIWIDPETDYLLKIIRVDPTTRIKYLTQQGEPEIETNIKSFVKNINEFRLSDDDRFNIDVERNVNGVFNNFFSANNVESYTLENWNFIDNDGILSQFGQTNQAPILNNNIQYKVTIWSNKPGLKYRNLSYFAWKESNDFVEIIKQGDDWLYNKFTFDTSSTDTNLNTLVSLLDQSILIDLYQSFTTNPNSEYSFTVEEIIDGIVENVEIVVKIKDLFSKKVNTSLNGLIKLEDNSLIEVLNGKIVKWFYMTPSELGYSNGDFSNSNLSQNGVKRVHSIRVETIGSGNTSPTQNVTNSNIPQFQIRIEDPSIPGGKIIDPSKILNTNLRGGDKFVDGKYGHGSTTDPQEIGIIERFMLTELDTESYYIIEGVLPDDEIQNSDQNVSEDDRWYRVFHAIGAIKPFIRVLVNIFSKLIPNIVNLIKLFKNPTSFITDIISEKIGESVGFLSKDSIKTFERGLEEQKNIESISDTEEKKKRVNSLKELFKNSKLSNYVFVSDEGKLISILDGASTIPFGVFGLNLPFGMKLNLSDEKKPMSLIFPKDLRFNKIKNIQNLLKPELPSNTTTNIFSDIADANSKKLEVDLKQPNLSNSRNQNESDLTQIKFYDGSSIQIPINSLDQFVLDNKTKYNFIFLEEEIEKELIEVDKLLDSGTKEDLSLASDKLTNLSKNKPNDPLIEERKEKLNSLKEALDSNEQPMLKLILGIVTLPVKIIAGILEWLIDFFKSLTNPVILPKKIAELLSFKWIMNFFTPKGILEMAGIKFNPDKIPEWVGSVKAKGPNKPENIMPKSLKLPPDIKIKGFNPKSIKTDGYLLGEEKIDLSEFLNVSFMMQLPKIKAFQHRQNPTAPKNILTGLFCLIEKLINGIIDFVWSTLGIEAIIKPPHIKLCSKKDNSEDSDSDSKNQTPNDGDADNNSKILSGEDADLSKFVYEVKLPNGEFKEFLNREELDKFIENNSDINYDFNF
jgi:hypothetical protein